MKKKEERSVWVRKWIAVNELKREAHGNLVRELFDDTAVSYENFVRMRSEDLCWKSDP